MIAHTLRLAVGEWHKLRRRWIPWILLGLIAFLMQAVLWIGYVTYHLSDDASEEDLSTFALPSSITLVTEDFVFLVIPMMILAATVVGVEYGWGTLRATLTRGVGRWQLLSAKFIMLMVAGIAGIIVLSASIVIASLLAGVIPPAEEGSIFVTEAEAWMDIAIGLGKLVYALVPYVALAVFVAVVTPVHRAGRRAVDELLRPRAVDRSHPRRNSQLAGECHGSSSSGLQRS